MAMFLINIERIEKIESEIKRIDAIINRFLTGTKETPQSCGWICKEQDNEFSILSNRFYKLVNTLGYGFHKDTEEKLFKIKGKKKHCK